MRVTDRSIEDAVSIVLRAGVVLAGLIVVCGGAYYVARHGREPVNYRVFQEQIAADYHWGGILRGVWRLQGRSMIQLGVLCLIATPIVRVIVSMAGFALERDKTYVLITAFVLGILLYSLLYGAMGAA